MSQHREAGEIPLNTAKPQGGQSSPASGSPGIWPPVTPEAKTAGSMSTTPSEGRRQNVPPAPPAPPVGQDVAASNSGPETTPTRSSRRHLVFGAAGLGIGVLVGIGLGQINLPFTSNAIEAAAEACSVLETFGIDLGDNGQSISMSSEGEDSAGAEYADISCVLAELEVPDSVETRIGTTRALDGRQSADWDKFTASWGYHPDSGLNIVIEIADN
ncbi:hypothetical protein ACFFON_10600 [Arthrobacter citreus]|uniref:hypothetical protein n=1 Tax=Arthrobacter TaxID=1663 RepID=UPI001265039D|nr:hypothetical protein [Arthrobacter gandavensis]